jgi:hypothetical protein
MMRLGALFDSFLELARVVFHRRPSSGWIICALEEKVTNGLDSFRRTFVDGA